MIINEGERLRIGIVPPLWTQIPPATYGGIELVVHLLAEELVRLGHDVTLFGTGDSHTSAKLEPVSGKNMIAYMAETGACVYEVYANAAVSRVLAKAADFDVLHFHIGMQWVPFASLVSTPSLFTVHTFASYDDRWLAHQYPQVALSGISRYQSSQISAEREIPVVYNGCDFSRFEPKLEKGQYLAFLGRMSEDKNPLGAIRIAQEAGMPIVLAGRPQQAKEEAYFDQQIKPLVDGRNVVYVGGVDHGQKNALLRDAAALVFPIQWPEPFGLVMIEAMACGTPVLARGLGSVPEVVEQGVTGVHLPEGEQMAAALPEVLALDRKRVREAAMEKFAYPRMVQGYMGLYRDLVR